MATLMLPAATGGANWQGGAFDPETKIYYIYSMTQITPLAWFPPTASDRTGLHPGDAPNPTRRRRRRMRRRQRARAAGH